MDVLKTSLSLGLKSANRIVWGYAMLNVKMGLISIKFQSNFTFDNGNTHGEISLNFL